MVTHLETLHIIKELGVGSFAKVVLAYDTSTRQKYAVKVVEKTKNQTENIARETAAGRLLRHDNIAKFIDHLQSEEQDFLIMEYVEGEDLITYLERREWEPFTEPDAKVLARQLVSALTYCHALGVIHMDIKLDNIIIDPTGRKVKIIDFGFCSFITNEKDMITRRCGSKEYCAPELLNSKIELFSAIKQDVWCLGTVIFCLLTAKFPFHPKRRNACIAQGQHPQLRLEFQASRQAKDLISKMLQLDPAKRITMKEVASHPWFR
jgi:carbon catabolite-derepressing protein kinase